MARGGERVLAAGRLQAQVGDPPVPVPVHKGVQPVRHVQGVQYRRLQRAHRRRGRQAVEDREAESQLPRALELIGVERRPVRGRGPAPILRPGPTPVCMGNARPYRKALARTAPFHGAAAAPATTRLLHVLDVRLRGRDQQRARQPRVVEVAEEEEAVHVRARCQEPLPHHVHHALSRLVPGRRRRVMQRHLHLERVHDARWRRMHGRLSAPAPVRAAGGAPPSRSRALAMAAQPPGGRPRPSPAAPTPDLEHGPVRHRVVAGGQDRSLRR